MNHAEYFEARLADIASMDATERLECGVLGEVRHAAIQQARDVAAVLIAEGLEPEVEPTASGGLVVEAEVEARWLHVECTGEALKVLAGDEREHEWSAYPDIDLAIRWVKS